MTQSQHPAQAGARPHLTAVQGGAVPLERTADAAAARLRIEPWVDPVVDQLGHDPRSAYAETYWLPVLGPSVTWMLRRFATYLDEAPGGAELCVEELARSLGIGERSGPNGPLPRTLKRCVDFQMARWDGNTLAVRRKLPPLARRHLRRLPETLQARHLEEVESALRSAPAGGPAGSRHHGA